MSFAAVAIGTAGAGLAQSVIGGINAHNAQSKIEKTPTPFYQPNKGLNDYYQEALNRYSAGPYNSQMYQQGQSNINRSLAAGIGALTDRRAGVAGVGALVGNANNALGQLGVQAEGQRNREFANLGQAATMKAGDDRLAFQYNQLMPYQKRMSILEGKAAAGNQMLNAGLQNVFNGIGAAGSAGAFKAGSVSPSSSMHYANLPGIADTAGTYNSPASAIPTIGPSPAGNISYINPNSYYNF